MIFSRKNTDIMVMAATEADLADISDLHERCFSRGWTQAELMGMFDQPNVTFLIAKPVAKPKSQLAGFNIVRQTADEAEIISIAVDPAQRNREVGHKLMREAINRFISDRVPTVFLEVDESNEAAIRLYRNLGFRQVGSRPAYYNSSDHNDAKKQRERVAALVMRLELV